ncbi:MAG: hypothetical protein RL318_2506 [Fibrobacterota bacterium]|jgi:hypothetical protein
MSATIDTLPKTFRALLGQTLEASFRKEIVETFFTDKDAQALARETFQTVAAHRKMRPQAFSKLPKAARLELFVAALSNPMLENAAMQCLQVWYLRKGKEVIAGYLNAWGVPHEDGELADEAELQALDPALVLSTTETLLATYPAQHLIGYLAYTRLAPPEASWATAVEPALLKLLSA